MRTKAVFHRSHARAALVAGLACMTLALSGCAAWRNQTKPAAPVSTAPDAVAADAGKSAAIANSGAQTTTVLQSKCLCRRCSECETECGCNRNQFAERNLHVGSKWMLSKLFGIGAAFCGLVPT
jgi:hypothetical protein